MSSAFIACAHGYLALVHLSLLGVYSVSSYRVASKKARKVKDATKAIIGEWGKILAVPQNYELAHHFGNMELEVGKARASFLRISKDVQRLTGVNWDSIGL